MSQIDGSSARSRHFGNLLKEDNANSNVNDNLEDGNIQSFFIDLDCQFLMVPKCHVKDVLIFRLLSVL